MVKPHKFTIRRLCIFVYPEKEVINHRLRHIMYTWEVRELFWWRGRIPWRTLRIAWLILLLLLLWLLLLLLWWWWWCPATVGVEWAAAIWKLLLPFMTEVTAVTAVAAAVCHRSDVVWDPDETVALCGKGWLACRDSCNKSSRRRSTRSSVVIPVIGNLYQGIVATGHTLLFTKYF